MHCSRSWVEISAHALRHNYTQLLRAARGVHLAPVVKANAYGHGLVPVAQLLDADPTVPFLSVAFLSEALELRAHGIATPIMVMSFCDAPLAEAAGHDIHFFVSNEQQVREIASVGAALGTIFDLHLKIDTGLSRFGTTMGDAVSLAQFIASREYLRLAGVCTHFSYAQAADQTSAREQTHQFGRALADITNAGLACTWQHCANSAAALFSRPPGNLVRVGAALYGMWPSSVVRDRAEQEGLMLKPVMQWKAAIAELRIVPAGRAVGYERTFVTKRPTRLAMVPVGYADGYDVRFSNAMHVLIGAKATPVVGRVAMNVMLVDVTDVPEATVGAQLILWQATDDFLASAARVGITNPRELPTRIDVRIPRIVVP